MNKHLLFIAPSAYPLGGVAVWLDYLIPGLESSGWRVTLGLVTGNHHDVNTYRNTYPKFHHVIGITNPTGSREGRVNSLHKTIRFCEPDMLVAVNIPDTYEAVNRLRMSASKAPHIAMAIHGFQPDLLDDIAEYRDVLDGVVCTNRLTIRLANTDAGMSLSRLHYAPYGIQMRDILDAKRLKKDKIRIAWVGRLEQFQKRIWDIPPILHELGKAGISFELVIAGGGLEQTALQSTLDQEGLLEHTHFLGVIPPERMQSAVYDACDALLVTSFWETGPIVIWEAMASGMPVVSSRYIGSGLEASLRHGENCLLFDIGDSTSAAVQLQKLLDSDLYHRLVSGGMELVNSRYSRKISIRAWDQSLREILRQPQRPPTLAREIPLAGKLDRIFGTRIGERLRRGLGLSHRHASAGGEWPHAHGTRVTDDTAFWSYAQKLDNQ